MLVHITAVAVLTALATACGGAPSVPVEPIDMDHELDTLYSCAQTTLQDAGYDIAGTNEANRMMSTTWRGDEARRHRAFVTVVLHPSYGPGVLARLAQQQRVAPEQLDGDGSGERPVESGSGEPSADPAWRDLPSDEQAVDWQDRFLAEVQACWRDMR